MYIPIYIDIHLLRKPLETTVSDNLTGLAAEKSISSLPNSKGTWDLVLLYIQYDVLFLIVFFRHLFRHRTEEEHNPSGRPTRTNALGQLQAF